MPIVNAKTVEPAKYRWQQVKDATSTAPSLQRRGNGTENWVGLRKENARGQYDFHILVKARTHRPFTLVSLERQLVHGLLRQRFEHPDIACEAFWDDEFGPLIRYTTPSDDLEAGIWAQGSVQIHATPQNGFELRREIAARREAQNKSSKSFTVHALADVTNHDTVMNEGSDLEFLVHFNHIYWDGISARLFFGDLLRSLGQNLEAARYDWGQEIKNLSVPLLDALKIDIKTLSKDYDDSLEKFVASMFRFDSSHSVQIGIDPGLPDLAVLKLTPNECQKIIHGVKRRLGTGYTITHLAQAATLLTLLKTNPLSQEALLKKSVIMPLPVNGRRYLREEFAHCQYGSCQACAVVEFDNLEQFAVDFEDKVAVADALIRAMEVTKKSYDYWLSKPFLLPLGLAKDNFLSSLLESSESQPDGKTVPIIASDGLNDQYIPKTVSSQDGSLVLSVENVICLTDSYTPGFGLRMEAWNGATTISLGYCDGSYTSEEAHTFLQNIKGFMMALAG
ncbi:15-O-acetyltransferase Tri3 [Aureobasidium pullulans]|uniref:15-O-acetyltransferase Tri3 n=1 Tax=Aureobasidium pullulans TaxID=5580 RepID=A0A4V4KJZ9_AURPU|nr:15-O-acetyltransferase Tri3 [Aureobasidium pullulans]